MAINKNAQLRYQILDRCFSNFRIKYTIEDLEDEVNDKLYDLNGTSICRRQLRDDIANMKLRPYCAPIKAYKLNGSNQCYYRYEDPKYSIYKNELSPDELAKLRSTIEMLGRYRGIPSYAWLEEVISSLEYRFGVKPNNEQLISFEQNEQLKGLEFLSELIDATINHQPLSILYKTYKGRESEDLFHPYYVKQYNNRWFLFGLEINKRGQYISNKALDRIVRISKATDVDFIPNNDINFQDYFKDIVGVTIQRNHTTPVPVVLKFDAERFPYIVSKPIHPSQETVDEEQHILRLNVIPNKELEAQIFSFGPQVEVLKPLWLRKQIARKIEECLLKYKNE